MLPTLPGEGIPRVLLEAMAVGLPVVTTRVAGIPSLVTHDVQRSAGRRAVGGGGRRRARAARRATAALRRRLIANGYETARAHTLEAQAARMMRDVSVAAGRDAARSRRGAGGVTDGPPRVCFVLPSLNGGGAERAAVQILNGLDARRWDRSMYLFRREGPYLQTLTAVHRRSSSGDGGSRGCGAGCTCAAICAAAGRRLVVSFLSYFSVLTAASRAPASARASSSTSRHRCRRS